jgi:hypothetical protein
VVGADRGRQNDAVGAGREQLALGPRIFAARDDGEAWIERARRQRDEDIQRVVRRVERCRP